MEKLIKGLPVKEYKRQWKLDNPEKVKEQLKKHRKTEKGIQTNKRCNSRWCKEHREERNKYERERLRKKKLEKQTAEG